MHRGGLLVDKFKRVARKKCHSKGNVPNNPYNFLLEASQLLDLFGSIPIITCAQNGGWGGAFFCEDLAIWSSLYA